MSSPIYSLNSEKPPPVASFPSPSVTNCPCRLNGDCKELCCLQELDRLRKSSSPSVDSIGSAQNGLLGQAGKLGHTRASYGSLEDQGMICPVRGASSPEPEDSISECSNESSRPLLNEGATRRSDLVCRSPTDDRLYHVRDSPLEESVRCGCHVKVVDHTTRKAVIKLVVAAVIAVLFMIGEVIGGYYAHSLAIMTDAAHMLSDFASFLISLFAIWVARRPPSSGMSFGWHRAEVIGAIVSVLIIWVLTGILVYEAVLRVIHRNFTVDPNIMLVTACVGVFVNVFHGHGGHGHSHGINPFKRKKNRSASEASARSSEAGETSGSRRGKKKKASGANINVQAAFIHVIGDLIQSIGVVIAGYVIYFTGWVIVDPICTFVFCILVLFSTMNVLKDALRVVMEGTPKHLDYEEVKNDLNAVEGVKHAHSVHIWSITLNRTALAAHLALKPGANSDEVLRNAITMLRVKHSINQSTLQVEGYQDAMTECGTCQEPERKSFLRSLVPSFLSRSTTPQN